MVDINSIMSIITLNVHALICVCVLSCVLFFFNPMDCSPPGTSVHGIFQAKILEWIAFLSPGDLSDPGIKTASLVFTALAGDFFTTVPPGKP